MLVHAAHATATFAEIGIAISLGLMYGFFTPKTLIEVRDEIRHKTEEKEHSKKKKDTRRRRLGDILAEEGLGTALWHMLGYIIKDVWGYVFRVVNFLFLLAWKGLCWITLMLAIAALLGLAYCPEEEFWTLLFGFASLLLSVFKALYTHRNTPKHVQKEQQEEVLGVLEPSPPSSK